MLFTCCDGNGRRCIDFVRQRVQIRNAEVTHRCFERLVPEHELNGTNRNSLRLPVTRTCFAKPVQVVMFANRMRLARRLSLPGGVVSSRRPRCCTVPAVHTRLECNSLELPKEMIVGTTLFVDEYPSRVWGVFLPCTE